MTNEKLIALLREARASVYQHKERLLDCDHDHETCTCNLAAKKIVLLSSIDDAIDAHNAAPARPEWVVGSWCHYPSRASSYRMGLPNTNIEVRRARDNKWSFLVTRHGLKDTLEEAQAAALDAAKEMA
jgi:hypothetical protein